MSSTRSWFSPLVVMTLWLANGCSHVNPDGFRDFSRSTSAFQAHADGAFSGVQDMAKRGYVDPSPLRVRPTFDQLLLVWDASDFTRTTVEAQPLYAHIREERRGAESLNEAIGDYAQYLALLAGGSEEDAKRIEELATQANGNLRSARDALGADIPDDKLAIASTVGAEILRQKIENDRRNFLREGMDSSQQTIESFAAHMALAMDLLASDVSSTYSAKVDGMRRQHSAAKASGKRRIELALLAHNDEVLLLLDTLRTLRESYKAVPVAHAQLRKQLDEPAEFLTAVRRLYDYAQRLSRLQKELAKDKAS